VDDGTGLEPMNEGQGLTGLHRRAAEAGARLTAGRRPGAPGFRVSMEVPE
jgi:two-component system sensor histidine kinase DesK